MTQEMIEKFVETKTKEDETLNIHFKDRQTVKGLFIRSTDYEEMKAKNFWRIVNHMNIKEWEKTKDMNLTRLFNGAAFTKLSNDKN